MDCNIQFDWLKKIRLFCIIYVAYVIIGLTLKLINLHDIIFNFGHFKGGVHAQASVFDVKFFTFNYLAYNRKSNQPWRIDRMFSQTVM